ncbi:DUF983 domain-containing protein [Breoghania sp. L-A4]|uniref:DUF983 domain-containing protein n=1 Tax=Breoghania sp. L-A4 TaxID=2304600 RepID=UPI000E35A818|nr:DUF983 domain-containing protein [Breoghania sp. L-A4]AXS39494.1 DUF983 domain-containing protein [Breoghania sp. L-A4]
MTDHDKALYAPQSPLSTALGCTCPRCGQGRLFAGFLKTAKRCSNCGLDFEFIDSGDGPAVFIIMIVGFIVVACAMVVEIKYMPPIWLHMVLWLPLTIVLSLGMLRPLKALMIALQYKHNAREGRLGEED